MMLPERLKSVLNQDRVVAHRFYEVFFARCPAARSLFGAVDLREQEVMLQMALAAITEYPNLSPAVASYLRVLGTRHRRSNVPRELYPAFFGALVATLAEFSGDAWNEALERQWEDAFKAAAGLMFEGYEQRFTT